MSEEAPDPYKEAKFAVIGNPEDPNYRIFVLQVTPDVGPFNDEVMEGLLKQLLEDALHKRGFTLKQIFAKSAGKYIPPLPSRSSCPAKPIE
jgi:hypothetical protein